MIHTPGLNHVVLTISDAAKSRAFYGGLLGFEIIDLAPGFYFVSGGVAFFFFPPSQPQAGDRFNEFRVFREKTVPWMDGVYIGDLRSADRNQIPADRRHLSCQYGRLPAPDRQRHADARVRAARRAA